MSTIYLRAALLGAVTGGRSMAGPTLVSDRLATREPATVENSPLSFFTSDMLATLFKVGAAGEMVADKLPAIPARTEAGPLAGRIFFGALSGFLLSQEADASPLLGALAGALGALLGTFGLYHLRRLLGESTPLPDTALALAEDLLVYGSGLALVRGA